MLLKLYKYHIKKFNMLQLDYHWHLRNHKSVIYLFKYILNKNIMKLYVKCGLVVGWVGVGREGGRWDITVSSFNSSIFKKIVWEFVTKFSKFSKSFLK